MHEATTKFCWTWQKKKPLWQLAKHMFFSYFENQTFLRFHSKRKGDSDRLLKSTRKNRTMATLFLHPRQEDYEWKWTCKTVKTHGWAVFCFGWHPNEQQKLPPWLRFQTSFLLQRSPEVFCTGMNQGGFGWRVAKGECANQQLLLTNSILMLYVLFKVWVVLCVRMIQCLYHPRMS